MPHIAEGLLHAHLDGALGPDGQLQWTAAERHLEQCADCRERLEEARALRSSARGLLAGAAATATGFGPGFEALAAEAAKRREGGADSSTASPDGSSARPAAVRTAGWWRSTARLAWAASLVMAAGAGWLGHELLVEQGGAPRPVAETAMETPAAAGAERRRTDAAADAVDDAAGAEAAKSGDFAAEREERQGAPENADVPAGARAMPRVEDEVARAPAAEEPAALAPQTLAQQTATEPRCFEAADGTETNDREPDADAAESLRGLRLETDGTVRGRTAAGSLVGFWQPASADSLVLRLTYGDGWREIRLEEGTDGLRGRNLGTAAALRRIDCQAF